MKLILSRLWCPVLVLLVGVAGRSAFAQTSGNIGYSQSNAKARAEAKEQLNRTVSSAQKPPNSKSVFVEASVLMNVKADAFVAVFALSSEGTTVAEAQTKMEATLGTFTTALKSLGLSDDAVDVDFVSQNKIYSYDVSESLAKEKLAGFEIKKNVSIHYKDKAVLDKIVATAAKSEIYDLVKVDYLVADTASVKKRMRTEIARLIKEKIADYDTLLGVKLSLPMQVYADRSSIYYPSEMYDSYTASESESIYQSFDRNRIPVQNARKTRTFFFNPLNEDGFDMVINPVVLEPVVQFTMYVKVKCDVKPSK